MAKPGNPLTKKALTRNEQKWTTTLMDAGWTAFPSVILDSQHALSLEPIDINILLHLAKHWYSSDNPPFPSKASIAKAMHMDPRSIQRRIARMEELRLIKRETRTGPNGATKSNRYLFTGLIAKATPYAVAAIEERKRHAKEKAARLARRGLKTKAGN